MPAPANNNLLTNDIILKTALMEYDNNLVLAKTARRTYNNDFNNTTGRSIRVRKPTRYQARRGREAAPQAIDEQYTQITVGEMIGVDVEITSEQFALQLDDFNREVIRPAMVTLANEVDMELYKTTLAISNFAGTAGSAPNTYAVADQCAAVLDNLGVPRGKERFMLLKTFDASALRSALYNTFNEKFNKEIILDGEMGNLAGFDVYSVQNAIRPSRGTGSLASAKIKGANQEGSELDLDGVAASATIKAGTLFTIDDVYFLNPTSRTDTGILAQFVVTEDAQADLSGNVTIKISINDYPLTLTGPYRNVSALPADGADVNFNATHTKNIFYHQEAFAFVSVKMPEKSDEGAWQRNMMNPKSKSNIRMTRQYDAFSDIYLCRFDVLPAFKCFPQYAGILMGS